MMMEGWDRLDGRYLLVSRNELLEIKELYRQILGKSSIGLFYSSGHIIGNSIADESLKREGDFFNNARDLMVERDLVKDVVFSDKVITVRGSIETKKEEYRKPKRNTCHILRGVLVRLYEKYKNDKFYCEEIECESNNYDRCVFRIEKEVF